MVTIVSENEYMDWEEEDLLSEHSELGTGQAKASEEKSKKEILIDRLQKNNQRLVFENLRLGEQLGEAQDRIAELKHDQANTRALVSENRRLRSENDSLYGVNEKIKKHLRIFVISSIAFLAVVMGGVCAYSYSKSKENALLKKELLTKIQSLSP